MHVDDLLPLFAMGLVDPQESAAVQGHLEGCAQCRDELQVFRADIRRLQEGGALASPPQSLWERIESRLGQPAPIAAGGRRASMPIKALGFAASLALVIIASVALTLLFHDPGAPDFRAALHDIQTDDVVFTLAAIDPATPAAGRIFMDDDRQDGVVAVSGLAQLPEDERYAVWILRDDDTRLSAGSFVVDVNGDAVSALTLPSLPYDWHHSGRYVALAISRVNVAQPGEPVGGPILVGPLY